MKRTATIAMGVVVGLAAMWWAGACESSGDADAEAYAAANAARGGTMYDNWVVTTGLATPAGNHPLWASRPDTTSNTRTGLDTWRCKECHGWDYRGVDGAYGDGSHRTGFPGILNTTMTHREVFDLLKNPASTTPNGHAFGAAGLSDAELWNLTRFVFEGPLDTSAFINAAGDYLGDVARGQALFTGGVRGALSCESCHGADGLTPPPGAPAGWTDFPGFIANDNPREFQHKVRFGQPGAPAMPANFANGISIQETADLGAFVQTLPES
ncbi:MAG: c-type cytochrome [Deltaproteobacteria bacterium]|nr:c-type cytochrome [Deltaproteobacteria bacterium]